MNVLKTFAAMKVYLIECVIYAFTLELIFVVFVDNKLIIMIFGCMFRKHSIKNQLIGPMIQNETFIIRLKLIHKIGCA